MGTHTHTYVGLRYTCQLLQEPRRVDLALDTMFTRATLCMAVVACLAMTTEARRRRSNDESSDDSPLNIVLEDVPPFAMDAWMDEEEYRIKTRALNPAVSGNETTCTDVYQKRCPFWANVRNYCSNPTFKTWMEKHCLKSCNNCRQCKDGAGRVYSSSRSHLATNCEDAARKGFCHHPHHFGAVSSFCPVSCKLCGSPNNPHNSCEDRFPEANHCPKWAQLDYCHSWADFMRYNCRRSCLYCGDCTDHYPTGVCSMFKVAGKCQKEGKIHGEMDAHCRKTCDLCPPKDPVAV